MLSIKNLCKTAGDFRLRNIDLHIARGDYFALLGVSGSGKTMLLEIIAGIRSADSGQIRLEGDDITFRRIQERGVGIVFQDGSVFPHLTVEENLAYPLKVRRQSRAEVAEAVEKWAQHTGITHLLRRRPAGLSGGELRRVALARTLAMNPKILLLDEPLSALDVLLQYDMMSLLHTIHAEGLTILHVTHDYHEAYALATRLAVLQDGQVVQEGTPAEVFGRPLNAFVAGLTGIKNYYEAVEAGRDNDRCFVQPAAGVRLFCDCDLLPGQYFYIRESEIQINTVMPTENMLKARVSGLFPFRGGAEVSLDAGFPLRVSLPDAELQRLALAMDGTVMVHVPATAFCAV